MLKFTVHDRGMENVARLINEAANRAETAVAVQVEKDTSPFVPMLTGSQVNRTYVEGKFIIYPGPYARYLYYGKVMEGPKYGPKHATEKDLVYTKNFHAKAQAKWFEASKTQNLEKWVRVAEKAVNHDLK